MRIHLVCFPEWQLAPYCNCSYNLWVFHGCDFGIIRWQCFVQTPGIRHTYDMQNQQLYPNSNNKMFRCNIRQTIGVLHQLNKFV
jgi:hypothetical protein